MTQKTSADTPLLDAYEPFEILVTWQQIFERSQNLINHLAVKRSKADKLPKLNLDPLNISEAYQELSFKLLTNPERLVNAQISYWTEHYKLLENVSKRAVNPEVAPYIAPERTDRRFNDEAWEQSPVFDYVKQAYLMTSRWLHDVVTLAELEEDSTHARKVEFYTQQLIDALSPSNFAATNPEVLAIALETGGKSLLDGLNNFLADLERGKGKLQIKMTDLDAFELGENIATTPGKVIYQNDLMQVIQYSPSTDKVHKRPLLIIPPWINKFYILDLRPKNSFIKWAVDQGHTVFILSWINPDGSHADKSFEHYMLEGPIEALDVIEQATGEKEVNAIGYCIGGTLLASSLAYLEHKKDNRIASATYFTTLLDFTDPGDLQLFIDEDQVSSIEEKMAKNGYLDGSEMAGTFNMLRPNDLIWSFYVDNYLKGNQASAFDLLYWNSDSTRMPAKMHSFYLRNMYLYNLLKEPKGVNLAGVDIDLSTIKTPTYFVSAHDDHIAPWKMTYEGTNLMGGPVRFVLGGSGHIAGIINPPEKNKYFYLTNNKTKTTKNPDTWIKGAKKNEGSWWPDWAGWVKGHADGEVEARTPGEGKLPALEDAPGSYVKMRITHS
ncbi:class I poly(R)-hydroxyalkanoic acid synthase [Candidatus Albibeggiatoa sp. nov. NOAA]|uniref:PHA/PHB synthase family protein n=1 Tax=Candidatus Albibeggiatoa sp. nov. NOAA TaxID=3162724 RepID=UPI00330059C3|nr:class I poly(R)-hydroxyalkanoic acid synthase [Thiotrichaceae bacterium]